jgi:2-amino-4-hydroxy-6-hydroxymethyldihydropteridine diphosphokinase
MTKHQAYLVLGSNIEPARNFAAALRLLEEQCHLVAQSPVYRTPPQGEGAEGDFLNMAVLVETDLSPAEFKQNVIAYIEKTLLRVRDPNNRNAPRTIDLDIALWDDSVLTYGEKPWRIPDPDILQFAHVAVPLAAIAPDYRHPETGDTLAMIAGRFGPLYPVFI